MEKAELQKRLAAIDLFEGLSKRAVKQIVNSGRFTEHPDGHEVIVEGATTIGFHFIVEGKAGVSIGDAPRRMLGVGDYFGEISAIDGKPRSASVKAVGPLRTFLVIPSIFSNTLDENPDFARQLMVLLCQRLREAEKRLG